MYSRSVGTRGNLPFVFPRVRASLVPIVLGGLGIMILARAVPDLLRQIGQPCAACYLGAFGPPLEPYGHPFKRHGDTATDGKPPLAMTVPVTVADPRDSLRDSRPFWIAPNTNLDPHQSFWFSIENTEQNIDGSGAPNGGAIVGQLRSGSIAMRHLRAADLTEPRVDEDTSGREMLNPWPASDFPGYGSDFAAIAGVATKMDAKPGQRTTRWGVLGSRDDPAHAELTAYRDELNPTALVPLATIPWSGGFIPHWRVTVQKDLQRHFPQIGTFGIRSTLPAADMDSFAGVTSIAKNQPPNGIVSEPPPAATPQIYEALPVGAGVSLLGVDGFNSLDTFRAGASYRFAETVTPTIRYFHIAGSTDGSQDFWPDVRPNSTGVTARFAYAPWDKPTSPIQFLNLRFAAQYAANKEISGMARGTGGNSTLVLSLWGALHF